MPSSPASLVLSPSGWAAALTLLTAVVVGATGYRPFLSRLPEPADAPDKPAYRDLATPGFVASCTAASGLALATPLATLPSAVWPMWWVLGVPVLLLAAVDAETTWLPQRLTRSAMAAMAVAALASALLGGWPLLIRALVGAVSAGGLYLALRRLSGGGIGRGDADVAALVGAATAAVGWPMLFWALLLGSLAGAGYAITLLLRGRNDQFAYCPAILGGAYLACVLRWLPS